MQTSQCIAITAAQKKKTQSQFQFILLLLCLAISCSTWLSMPIFQMQKKCKKRDATSPKRSHTFFSLLWLLLEKAVRLPCKPQEASQRQKLMLTSCGDPPFPNPFLHYVLPTSWKSNPCPVLPVPPAENLAQEGLGAPQSSCSCAAP